MPAYNAEKTIAESIESVLNQTYSDFELIVIDDCSKDNTFTLIKKLALEDSRIKVYKNENNSGVSKTRNFGIKEAKGDWIAFLDSDDIWEKDKLEKQINFIKKHSDAVLTYTASAFMNGNGEKFSFIMNVDEKITYKQLLKGNKISCSSVMVKAKEIKQIKMAGDHMHEDYCVWLTLLKKHKYAYGLDEPLLVYRLSEGTRSSNRLKAARMSYNSYRHMGYNVIVSAFFVFRYTFYSVFKRSKIKFSK